MKTAAITAIINFIILVAAIMAAIMIPDVVRGSLALVLRTVSIAIPTACVIFLAYFLISAVERVLTRRAERKNIEHESAIRFLSAPGDHQAWIHQADGTIRNLSLDARWIIRDDYAPSPGELQAWHVYRHSLRAPAPSPNGAPMLMEAQPPTIDILTALQRTPRALIVGASNTGKSTMLRWLARSASQDGQVIVLDPHSPVDAWPPGCTVIGTGSRHDLIERALDELVHLMIQRYKQIGRGEMPEGSHSRVTIIVDEWMSIAEQTRNAKSTLVRLLTESRKAAFSVYIGSHSDRVRSLGLDGRGDLRRGFEIYHLDINMHSGERHAWLEVDGQRTPLALPGAYPAGHGRGHVRSNGHDNVRPSQALEPLRTLEEIGPDGFLPPAPGSEAARVCQMYLEGHSLREITEAVWNNHGQFYNDKARRILEDHGIECEGEK